MSETRHTPFLDARVGDLRIADAMHEGIVSCSPETPLSTVARRLASYRVHAIIVFPRRSGDLSHLTSWRVVSDLDLARAALQGDLDAQTAGDVAATPVCCMTPGESLVDAIKAMVGFRLWHVVVVDQHAGRPIGMLSTLDVARALGDPTGPRTTR